MNTDDEKGPLKRVPIIKIQSQQQKKDSLCHINLSNLGHVYCGVVRYKHVFELSYFV